MIMILKSEYLGKRVSLITTKGKPLVVILDKSTPEKVLKEIAIKWPHWVEKQIIDAQKEQKDKEHPKKDS